MRCWWQEIQGQNIESNPSRSVPEGCQGEGIWCLRGGTSASTSGSTLGRVEYLCVFGLPETILQIRKVVQKQRIHEFGGVNSKHLKKVHPVESNCMKIRRKGVDDHIYNQKHPQTFFMGGSLGESFHVTDCSLALSSALLTGRHVWHGQKILRGVRIWHATRNWRRRHLGATVRLRESKKRGDTMGYPINGTFRDNGTAGLQIWSPLCISMRYPNLAMYWWLASLRAT